MTEGHREGGDVPNPAVALIAPYFGGGALKAHVEDFAAEGFTSLDSLFALSPAVHPLDFVNGESQPLFSIKFSSR